MTGVQTCALPISTHTEEEHDRLVELTVEMCAGKMKTIVGVGGYNTEHVLEQAKHAEMCGADGILMVTPYYNKSTQKGLIEHFTYVADRVKVPMILYNVPGRTGIGIKNVNDRLKIYFGRSYGLSITSEPDVGTCVEIRMPKVREGDHETK